MLAANFKVNDVGMQRLGQGVARRWHMPGTPRVVRRQTASLSWINAFAQFVSYRRLAFVCR
jgi:hypothetical protein